MFLTELIKQFSPLSLLLGKGTVMINFSQATATSTLWGQIKWYPQYHFNQIRRAWAGAFSLLLIKKESLAPNHWKPPAFTW
jgi:hypothetical protein